MGVHMKSRFIQDLKRFDFRSIVSRFVRHSTEASIYVPSHAYWIRRLILSAQPSQFGKDHLWNHSQENDICRFQKVQKVMNATSIHVDVRNKIRTQGYELPWELEKMRIFLLRRGCSCVLLPFSSSPSCCSTTTTSSSSSSSSSLNVVVLILFLK